MKRRPRDNEKKAIPQKRKLSPITEGDIGIVLSGGGARAAYQVGALKALIPYLSKESNPIGVVMFVECTGTPGPKTPATFRLASKTNCSPETCTPTTQTGYVV